MEEMVVLKSWQRWRGEKVLDKRVRELRLEWRVKEEKRRVEWKVGRE